MLVVGLARGAKRAEDAALDRRGVRRAQADGGAELVVRVGVLRVGGDPLARASASALLDRVAEGRRRSPAAGGGSVFAFGLFGRPR